MQPILKWAGGKRKIRKEILHCFPKDYAIRNYHEPFFGAGSLFFEIKPNKGSINDINSKLIKFYEIVKNKPEELIEQTLNYKYEKDEFYKLRDRFNKKGLLDLEYASLLLYFNKTAYNGLYRENSKGEFNVPFGDYTNPTIVSKKRIMEVSRVLQNITIFNKDFEYIEKYAKKGDICYFDPPYEPLSKTSHFTSYSKDNFNLDDQIRLRDTCLKLHEKEVWFVLSNSDLEKIKDMYNEKKIFQINKIKSIGMISGKTASRGPINHILVTNVPKNIQDRGLESFV